MLMSPKTAQIIFVIFNILAVVAVVYAINDYLYVSSSVTNQSEVISFDSGTYYLILISVFWVFSVIQYVGQRNEQSWLLKYANQVIIAWFVVMLILANVIPHYLQTRLEYGGYTKCEDPAEISRVGRGESSLYMRPGCD